MSAFPFAPVMPADLVTLTIQALSYNPTTGAFTTSGSAVSIRGTMDSFSDELTTQHDDIRPYGTGKANNVPTVDDSSFSVTVWLDHGGTDYNKLRQFWNANKYFRISYTEGISGSSSDKVETFDMSRGNLSNPRQGDGGQKCTATFLQIDTGSSFRTRTDPA